MKYLILISISLCPLIMFWQSKMMFGDTIRIGIPFSNDPHVTHFKGRYLMYYSIPPYKDKINSIKGWGIGIAESKDFIKWEKIGEITPNTDYEKKGLCAPCALVIDDVVHLFYQTYGNGRKDATCHAKSKNKENYTNVKLYENKLNYFNLHCHIIGICTM